jgi:orotate phosphoribosyltransferase
MNHMETLKKLIDDRCIQRGDFTLASGAKSTFYIDARKLLKSDALEAVGFGLWKTLFYAVKEYDAIGGMEAGAIPLTTAFLSYAHQINRRFADKVEGFYVRKQPKGHGTGKLIEGNLKPFSKCVVLEDVTTTGGSALKAVRALEAEGHTVVHVCTLIDRSEQLDPQLLKYGFSSVFTLKDFGLEPPKPAPQPAPAG